MDIAVTGSTGFIGQRLCAELTANRHRVLRIQRPQTVAPNGAATADRDVCPWDPTKGTIDTASLEGIDAVIHLAGEPIAAKRWDDAQKERIRSSRVDGTTLLATTLANLNRPPSVLISGSAIGFYGDTGQVAVDESSRKGDGFLADVVAAWEAAARPAIDANIRTVFARTGIVLSPKGGVIKQLRLPIKFFLGGRSGPGTQWMSWISLTDEVEALQSLLHYDVSGPVNLVAPNPVTNSQFMKAVAHAYHRPSTISPMFGPRMLMGRELADTLLLDSQRVKPTVLEGQRFNFTHTTIEQAANELVHG